MRNFSCYMEPISNTQYLNTQSTMLYEYPVFIHHIFISPGHNYFGHKRGSAPGSHPTYDVEQVETVAGLGLKGDRFYDIKQDFDGQITFFAWEVYQQLVNEFGLTNVSPMQLRRNVIISGVNLNQLIGHEFEIGGIRFLGRRHCNPCRWMDDGVSPGALKFLKGRGGLRAQILSSGILPRGNLTLHSSVPLDPSRILDSLPKPRLP